MRYAIGCDVGATHQRVALVDVGSGKIVDERKTPSRVDDYAQGLVDLVAAIRALSGKRRLSIGVGIAGHLDPSAKKIIHAPNLNWRNAPLARDLQKRLSVPIALDNDVRVAALGELSFGSLRGVTDSAACVFWGSGIGGAVVAGGRVVRGSLALAGEVGHLTYVLGGRLCACGKKGCVEAYCGGHVLDADARRQNPAWTSAKNLFAARHENATAGRTVDEAKAAVGFLLGQVAQLLDPERIVIGGGLGLSMFKELAPQVKPYLLPAKNGKLTLVKSRLGDNAGIIGAARLARDGIQS